MLLSDLKRIVKDLEKSSNEKTLWKLEDNSDLDLHNLDFSILEDDLTITIQDKTKNSEFIRVYKKPEKFSYIRTCQDCKQEFESPRQFEAICEKCK
jgi:rRNA maturation endonuclease Nob1